MWAPGTYLPDRGEGDAVHANIGVEKYFFAAGDQILNRIKEVRNTAILPERTGPIADVLYSAAGNSADEHWYNRDVIAYSFETGADRFVDTTLAASAAGATGHPGQRTGTAFDTGDTSRSTPGTPNEEVPHRRLAREPEPGQPGAERRSSPSRSRSRTPAGAVRGRRRLPVGRRLPAATTRPRASSRRSSSRPATTACSSRRSRTRATRSRRRSRMTGTPTSRDADRRRRSGSSTSRR